jgi:hypothetical protein
MTCDGNGKERGITGEGARVDPRFSGLPGGARAVEAAVLAIVIERSPGATTEAALVLDMLSEVVHTPERVAAIRLAVVELIAVGLLVRAGDVLEPTLAASRAAELELGLC